MGNSASKSNLLKSVGTGIALRLPKSLQKIASLEAKYFNTHVNGSAIDNILDQQGGGHGTSFSSYHTSPIRH